jgi:hypothetical protein
MNDMLPYMDMRQRSYAVAPRFRLALALLLAAASLVAASRLAAQVRPLGDEEVVVSGEESWGSCPVVAGHDDGSAVVLRSHGGLQEGGELLSVSAAVDGSFSSDHLLDPGAGADDYASVTATADGYVAVWRLPGIWLSPGWSLPGEYAGVALDAAGAPTSAPVLLHHRQGSISPRRIGGWVATTPSAGRNGLDVQLLSPLGEAVSAPAAVVRTRWDTVAIPQAVLHRPDGRFTVLWTEMRRIAGRETWLGTWMRRVSAGGRPIGPVVRLLPAAPPGVQQRVSAAIAADGTLALAWTELATVHPRLQTFTATGIPLGRAVSIVNPWGFVEALSFGAGGDVLVLWQDLRGPWPPPQPIRASLFSRRGEPRGAAVDLASGASAANPWMLCADVASTGSGPDGESWLVFWLASDLPANDFRIFARRFVFDSTAGADAALSGSPR